jgi:hypothetical protein
VAILKVHDGVSEVEIGGSGLLAGQAKGTILATDTTQVWNGLAVGADGQLLIANAGETLGLEWVGKERRVTLLAVSAAVAF